MTPLLHTPQYIMNEMLAAGTKLGPYTIVASLGAGGMGEVYRARDSRLDREVAIKVLPEHLAANPSALKRFQREAKAVAALSHPNILNIHDVGVDIGISYMVTECLEGETLRARIARLSIPVESAVEIARSISEGLAAAHSKGFIHRDLKPENVFLTSDGRVKILDFGLARYSPEISQKELEAAPTASAITEAGAIMGTAPYMSPEQVRGDPVDARSDIFSFGSVLYEIITRQRAFPGSTSADIVSAILGRDPQKPPQLTGHSVELFTIASRCLRKNPDQRFQAAQELASTLRTLQSEITRPLRVGEQILRQLKRPVIAASTFLLVLLVVAAVVWSLDHRAKIQWAKEQALPEIKNLILTENYPDAYALANKAKQYIPEDPNLNRLWDDMSFVLKVHTNPEGADVSIQEYRAINDPWQYIGRSPFEVRIPWGPFRWKIQKEGYETADRAFTLLEVPPREIQTFTITLDKKGSLPAGMVRVQGREFSLVIPSVPLPPVLLEDYFMDKYEVTNKQFSDFVKSGGYQRRDYWKHKFLKEGHELSWEGAMREFRDSTGRPGPAAWEAGDYQKGEDQFPVTGVSWYEAAAYAEFAHKSLPTVYHWSRAAAFWNIEFIVPMSNFSGKELFPAGSKPGMSQFGTYDMAGNAKEWCWNERGDRRYILGGDWSEPSYFSPELDAQSPFSRSTTYGFRCVKYLGAVPQAAASPVNWTVRDYRHEAPVTDEIFQIYKRMYSYDKTELHPTVESVDDSAKHWKVEKVAFDAAYGNERVTAYLFLPKNARPPYQTVNYFAGSQAIFLRSSKEETANPMTLYLDFILQSGRAVLFPIYKGTYERGDDLKSDYPDSTIFYRDHVIQWSKDLGRSIDYLQTRKDIDTNKLAFYGISWGASMGLILPALEPRLKTSILVSGGFYLQNSLPEVDQINFISRVTIPTLMLNGKYDMALPMESSQIPAFQLLGASDADKKQIVYDVTHFIPRKELIRETLDWLDRYLGPVSHR